jgi:hypothetical protein
MEDSGWQRAEIAGEVPGRVALAEKLDVSLVTADRKLLRAFPDSAVSPKDFIHHR